MTLTSQNFDSSDVAQSPSIGLYRSIMSKGDYLAGIYLGHNGPIFAGIRAFTAHFDGLYSVLRDRLFGQKVLMAMRFYIANLGFNTYACERLTSWAKTRSNFARTVFTNHHLFAVKSTS
jgi:hypothetical protein